MSITPQNLGPDRPGPGTGTGPDGAVPPGDGGPEDTVGAMSSDRGEPAWMRDIRIEALRHVDRQAMPPWARELSAVPLDGRDHRPGGADRDRHPGVGPAGHRSAVGGGARTESDEVAERRRREFERRGVVFCDMATALRDHPELVEAHFARVVPLDDGPFSALNTSLWSGGSFVYVPPGVAVDLPLQSDSRTDPEHTGRFGRTLIIADEGATVHYIDGCSAPVYSADPLRSAVVEVVVGPSAHVTCTTIQNWSSNVVNVVTKRASVEAEGHMTWIDGNVGSRRTASHTGIRLVGPEATGEILSMTYAGRAQDQGTEATVVHASPETSSTIVWRSVSRDGGRSTHRDLVRVDGGANGCRSHVRRDAMILDDESSSGTDPRTEIGSPDARLDHASSTVSGVSDEHLFYLMSRGLSEEQAVAMVVDGFIEPVTRRLPMEYAVEWSRLIELHMGGSVG